MLLPKMHLLLWQNPIYLVSTDVLCEKKTLSSRGEQKWLIFIAEVTNLKIYSFLPAKVNKIRHYIPCQAQRGL